MCIYILRVVITNACFLFKRKSCKKIFNEEGAEMREGADVGIKADVASYNFNSEVNFLVVIAFAYFK